MSDLSFLSDYVSVLIVGICLCIGFILKNVVVTDKINRFIPLIMGCLGLILQMWIDGWTLTPASLLTGLFSGLASTGLYEMFKNLIDKGGAE